MWYRRMDDRTEGSPFLSHCSSVRFVPAPIGAFCSEPGNSFPGGLARRAWEFIPRRSGTTGVGIHSPALWHDGRGNSFPGALARRAWEFIPRRSGTTGVGIHSPAVWHDGRGNSFPGGLARRAWEFIPRRSRTTGVGIHSPALSHDGRGNSFPGALARRAWEFIPRRSGTTGVGIHSPALWHDGDSDFAIPLDVWGRAFAKSELPWGGGEAILTETDRALAASPGRARDPWRHARRSHE